MILGGIIYILRHALKYEYQMFNHFNNPSKLLKMHKGKLKPKMGQSALLKQH